MELYTVSKSLNPKRVFILQKSELEKRFDPFFYVPELLEKEIVNHITDIRQQAQQLKTTPKNS